jgi:hypothetical protein
VTRSPRTRCVGALAGQWGGGDYESCGGLDEPPAATCCQRRTDRLVAMTARGWSELDWSALGRLAAGDAGLDSRDDADDAATRAA